LLNDFIQQFGVVPTRLVWDFSPEQVLTIFSAMFMHGGWLHLISNMWAFFIFGDNVEDRLGHTNFLVFYLFCGTIAAISQVLMSVQSAIPMVGASGALAGVLGAYILLFPRARIITLVPLFFIIPWFIEIPAIIYLGLWFLTQFFTGLGALESSPLAAEAGVAWWAHIAGFIAGVVLVKLFEKRPRRRELLPDEFYPW
jgi:membrane associated rhomboid family serine protease